MAHRNAVRRAATALVTGFVLLISATAATVRLSGIDYGDLPGFGRRYGLTVAWTKPARELRLHSEWTRLEFEAGSREFSWNGLRIFLGEPALARKRGLWLSATDLDATLAPLLKPAAGPAPGALRVIALDPGHGGNDPGTENRRLKLQEKTFTLDVVQRLQSLLEQRGYRIVLTRDADRYVSLPARPEVAKKGGADLFISVHFNSLEGNARVRGVETYALTPAGQRSTAVAERRSSDKVAQPGNRHDHWNMVLAAAVHRQLVEQMGAMDRGLKHARWAVLRDLDCPGVLVEAGFLSHAAEAGKIKTPAYRQLIAETIAAGVDDYADRLKQARAGRS